MEGERVWSFAPLPFGSLRHQRRGASHLCHPGAEDAHGRQHRAGAVAGSIEYIDDREFGFEEAQLEIDARERYTRADLEPPTMTQLRAPTTCSTLCQDAKPP
jgi:hypothetical protein